MLEPIPSPPLIADSLPGKGRWPFREAVPERGAEDTLWRAGKRIPPLTPGGPTPERSACLYCQDPVKHVLHGHTGCRGSREIFVGVTDKTEGLRVKGNSLSSPLLARNAF
ncbi:uncharacterized protein LOC103170217 [Ornithorhynchus anatinus]|uniref:uncharacterized protein LOC103170217 n=1 Tax=Ornithorhynchus anatinus TaxID=9258 RepID=UPI0019D454EA|nr:uncharacterized protein LOC103170217 [Ornithorhynchus anatinus]XP_039770562.1 uncharacterized protein LOC103170217 [Ornithorhynchus anatinus]